jgi:hypothetical protein
MYQDLIHKFVTKSSSLGQTAYPAMMISYKNRKFCHKLSMPSQKLATTCHQLTICYI